MTTLLLLGLMFVGAVFALILIPLLLLKVVFALLVALVVIPFKILGALIGGLTAGVLWAASGAVFTKIVAISTQMVAIYAGFAIFLAALIWIYLSWLILLIGAQLSFYVQNPRYLRVGQTPVRLTSALRERLAFTVMLLIARKFVAGEAPWRQRALAERLDRMRAGGQIPGAAELAQEAKELARSLEAGRLDRQTVERQERLFRRMLDAGRTLQGQEEDEKQERQSTVATDDSIRLPPALRRRISEGESALRLPTWEELQALSPDDRRRVVEYFRRLAEQPRGGEPR